MRNNYKNIVEKKIKRLYNIRIEKKLVNYLLKNNLTLSVAESCTGGLIASKIVNVSGASQIFYEGLVTYSNESKIKRLGVKVETLEKHGAVSEEVAHEMLRGLTTDVGISTTGIAGPTGGTKEKPVGLVYIGIKIKDKYIIKKYNFKGTREQIRNEATVQALKNLLTEF